MNKPHKHAALMLQFAKDAAETETPWERWEYSTLDGWTGLVNNPSWSPDFEYRRKPQTININGFEVPEPMREKPKNGTLYYVISMEHGSKSVKYMNDGFDLQWLSAGLSHLTREAAELHAKALRSFTCKI